MTPWILALFSLSLLDKRSPNESFYNARQSSRDITPRSKQQCSTGCHWFVHREKRCRSSPRRGSRSLPKREFCPLLCSTSSTFLCAGYYEKRKQRELTSTHGASSDFGMKTLTYFLIHLSLHQYDSLFVWYLLIKENP